MTTSPSMEEAFAAFLEGGRAMMALVQNVQAGLRQFFAPGGEGAAWLQNLAEAARAWHLAQEQLGRLPGEAQEAFQAAGLPPWRHVSLDDILLINRTFKADGAEAVVALVEAEFRKALADEAFRGRLLEDWSRNPLLAKRGAVLQDALRAAANGLHSLAVPVFLAQLEGVIADGFNHVGQMREPKYKAYVADLSRTSELFGSQLTEFVLNIVLVHFEHGKALESSLSRHAILHGADHSYGTAHNSMRAIMLFDYVQDLLMERKQTTAVGSGA